MRLIIVMARFIIFLMLLMNMTAASAQGIVKGKVLDKNSDEALGFVNVKITPQGATTLVKGAVTDVDGKFIIQGLENGQYTLTLTFVGYKNLTRNFVISDKNKSVNYPFLYLTEDAHTLKEVTVTGMKSAMKLEVDRKSYDVSQLITNSGDAASDVLENIPSVEVDNDGNISLRGNTSVEVWINGKASGLTSDNRAEILQQLPAESIDHIEVIDNPSAKFSAEGSAGIINIVLKKDRKPGYYGSVQAGGSSRGGANSSFNINYSSPLIDFYANVGYRHRANTGKSSSQQEFLKTGLYEDHYERNNRMGNNLFSRAGVTLHATKKDDIALSGMLMTGRNKSWSNTPYHYGTVGAANDTYLMMRSTRSAGNMNMYYGELNYRHNFTDKHFLDFTVDFNRWKADMSNIYQDSTTYYDGSADVDYNYQSRPLLLRNRTWETKLDYENPITDKFKIQAGYQGRFSHENTPQESYEDKTYWDGRNQTEDETYYNRFIYDMDLHALYATATYNIGKFGIMGGLRGEYWRVNTESYTWAQEHDATKRDAPFKKDYFQLFPSVFLSYQLTQNDQLQLNYTRRLRRPWGGQLNSFKNTSDASIVSFGNPELTPEYSNSFSLNYLKTWTEHSLILSAYYRPTTDVMQHINYQSSTDGLMYSTTMNVAKSLNSGLEMVLKDKLFRILDLTTTADAYYYKLDGFSYDIDGQTVTGDANHNFTWSARMTASMMLPYDISVQASGRYRGREVIPQGYRKANYSIDLGVRKNFLNKKFTLSISCRDLLNSRRWETFTSSDTFTRNQMNKRGGRRVNFTLTWNFGNQKQKKRPDNQQEQPQDDNNEQQHGQGMGEE
jgi:iron complex outermembrane receptor protein